MFDVSASNAAMQYGQNISIPYSQPQNDHNNMFGNDHKDNLLKTKMERDREEGLLFHLLTFRQTLTEYFCILLLSPMHSDKSTNSAKCQSIMADIS